MLIYKLKALFHPERYHGWGKTKRYFEGWYYKVVNESEDRAFAFIPGISMDENGNQQAFIQILDGKKLTAAYHRFHAQEFQTKAGIFEVRLANNIFTCENIQLDLPGIKGALNFVNQVAWPNKWYSPGIMGPYSFVPFMECYHGIVSMDHLIQGGLTIEGKYYDFTNGRGYIEKDWGKSMPSSWIWIQTNNFKNSNSSIMLSVAKIPWLGFSFTGFLGFYYLNNEVVRFGTYSKAKVKLDKCEENSLNLNIVLRDKILEIQKKHGSFNNWLDKNMTHDLNSWIKLFKENFKFTGYEITKEFLFSTGYLKGAHNEDCPTFKKIENLNPKWKVIS